MESVEYNDNGMPIDLSIQPINNEEEQINPNRKQVFVNDLRFDQKAIRKNSKFKELPTQLIYDIPATVIKQATKKNVVFNDIIETYVLNSLTRKFAHEVVHAQIWIMFDVD